MTVADALYALLFVADAPLTVPELAAASGFDRPPVEGALRELQARLDESGPVQLVQLAGGYQLATRPEYASMITRLLQPQRQRLSRSLMEVLAVVAYKQPVTTSEIETVRGVDCSYAVRGLLERRLIKEGARRKTPGRPIEYVTTPEFLHQFKMNSLGELPPLQEGSLAMEAGYNEETK